MENEKRKLLYHLGFRAYWCLSRGAGVVLGRMRGDFVEVIAGIRSPTFPEVTPVGLGFKFRLSTRDCRLECRA